jgi:hypothetical protein
MVKYQLVNPYLKGTVKTEYSAGDVLDAAQQAWTSISNNFTNDLPKFAFTLSRGSDRKLFHFVVREERNGTSADVVIEPLKLPNVKKSDKHLKSQLKKIDTLESQSGGKKNDDDDSDDSDKDDDDVDEKMLKKIINKINYSQPIAYWWYSPLIYELNTIYTPTFVTNVIPYTVMDMSYAFLIV